MKKILIIPDTHIPFHDQQAWDLVLKVARGERPDHVIIMGDWLDMYSLSKHRKDPELRHWDFASELEVGKSEMDRLQKAAPKADIVWLEGNHEQRLGRLIADDAPSIHGMVSIPKEMDLKKRGIKWVPYQDIYTLGKVNYTHDTGSAGGTAHTRAEQDLADNVVIGHTHRMSMTYVGNKRHQAHVAAMFGWLGDKKYAKYVSPALSNRYWMLGFGMGYMTSEGVTYLQPHPIINYTACVGGKIYV